MLKRKLFFLLTLFLCSHVIYAQKGRALNITPGNSSGLRVEKIAVSEEGDLYALMNVSGVQTLGIYINDKWFNIPLPNKDSYILTIAPSFSGVFVQERGADGKNKIYERYTSKWRTVSTDKLDGDITMIDGYYYGLKVAGNFKADNGVFHTASYDRNDKKWLFGPPSTQGTGDVFENAVIKKMVGNSDFLILQEPASEKYSAVRYNPTLKKWETICEPLPGPVSDACYKRGDSRFAFYVSGLNSKTGRPYLVNWDGTGSAWKSIDPENAGLSTIESIAIAPGSGLLWVTGKAKTGNGYAIAQWATSFGDLKWIPVDVVSNKLFPMISIYQRTYTIVTAADKDFLYVMSESPDYLKGVKEGLPAITETANETPYDLRRKVESERFAKKAAEDQKERERKFTNVLELYAAFFKEGEKFHVFTLPAFDGFIKTSAGTKNGMAKLADQEWSDASSMLLRYDVKLSAMKVSDEEAKVGAAMIQYIRALSTEMVTVKSIVSKYLTSGSSTYKELLQLLETKINAVKEKLKILDKETADYNEKYKKQP
ncbi:MAG: hypothetical protein V4539_04405 [Bacteroidota bacterium]